MDAGKAWTRTNDKDGSTYISIALDEAILELYPQFKNLNFTLGWISEDNRKSENSPSWNFKITAKKQIKQNKEAVKNAEEQIINSAQKTEEKEAETAADLISEEDIPF